MLIHGAGREFIIKDTHRGLYYVVFSHADQNWHVAFKARTEMVDPETGEDRAPTDGIYLRKGPNAGLNQPLVVTGMDGTIIDPDALDVPSVRSAGRDLDSRHDDSVATQFRASAISSMQGQNLSPFHR